MTINLQDNSKCTLTEAEEIAAVRKIGNRSVGDLLERNKGLLVFPLSLLEEKDEQGLKSQQILSYHDEEEKLKVQAHNIAGFIGYGGVDINISSRFAKGKGDFFLHYMLQKVLSINLLDMPHSSSPEDEALDWMLLFFPPLLKEALSQGLYKEYRTFEYNDDRVRGPIDVSRYIRYDIPFNGKIAYRTREYSHDNPVTELVRHTIEYISTRPWGKVVLNSETGIREAVSQIREATPSYNIRERISVIQKNARKAVNHPYYTHYRSLQTLCLQILRHETLKYDRTEEKSIYGVLFDVAWLWEEYLNKVFEEHSLGLKHPRNKAGEGRIYLGRNSMPRYPDYYSEKAKVAFDAKYRRRGSVGRDDQNQMVAYLYRLQAQYGGFILPLSENESSSTIMDEDGNTVNKDEVHDLLGYGEDTAKLGYNYMTIPQNTDSYCDFIEAIKEEEENISNTIEAIISK